MATVHKLSTAKDMVDEVGKDQVDSVYSYKSMNGDKLYAVFFKGTPVDIYTSIYCRDQKCIFENGKWLL